MEESFNYGKKKHYLYCIAQTKFTYAKNCIYMQPKKMCYNKNNKLKSIRLKLFVMYKLTCYDEIY